LLTARAAILHRSISVNKPFKVILRKEYEVWLLPDNLSPGKTKRASASELAEWASAAWKLIAGRAVEESFKKLCI
jgi:hypothetical protein